MIYVAQLNLTYWTQGRGLRVTQNVYFSPLTHTKQLLLVTFCDTTAGIRNSKVLHTALSRR